MKQHVFEVESDFEAFAMLGGSDVIEFSDERYQCIDGLDFTRPSVDWCMSKGMPESAGKHCSNLQHGRNIYACQLRQGGWVCICYGNGDYLAIPFTETEDGNRVLFFYDQTWLDRLSVFMREGDYYYLNADYLVTDDIVLPERSCLIPGSRNPSHFMEHLVKHEILATSSSCSGFSPWTIELTAWEKDIVRRLSLQYCDQITKIGLIGCARSGVHIVSINDALIFEEVPQWLGLQHARRIMRQLEIEKGVESNIVYLCRARHEIGHSIKPGRVFDRLELCKLLNNRGALICYPELYSPIEVQRIISCAAVVIADPGSCNIHALVSPSIKANGVTSFWQLTPRQHFNGDDHDSVRSFEWFANLKGAKFTFIFGREVHEATRGSVRSAMYAKAVSEKLEDSL